MCSYLAPPLIPFGVLLGCGLAWHQLIQITYKIILFNLFIRKVVFELAAPLCSLFGYFVF
uniref:Transmembrane protein n=1 Tax=Medicago truncatula TaxID=3880 RepID=Q2HW91_MEDTR|nr:hypothetical protein MtrDRAFT_AC147774g7v1 [Medicago truncatula]